MALEVRAPRCTIYDGSFQRLGRLTTVQNVNRAYRMDGQGQAVLEVAANDPIIQYTGGLGGRVLVIESSIYPVPWVGIIIGRGQERSEGTRTLVAKGFEGILRHRSLPNRYTASGTAGNAMQALLSTVNRRNNTGIGLGNIHNHGFDVTGIALSNARAKDALDTLAESGGLEWWVDYDVRQNAISPQLRISRDRGFDLFAQGVKLVDGEHLYWTSWKEDGEAAAFAYTIIAGATSFTETFTERSRATKFVTEGGGFVDEFIISGNEAAGFNSDEIVGDAGAGGGGSGAFGYEFRTFRVPVPTTTREVVEINDNIRTRDVTGQTAEARIQTQRLSDRLVKLKMIPPAALGVNNHWRHMQVGNVFRLVLPTAFDNGFDGVARVLGFQPAEEDPEQSELVVELGAD